MKRNVTLTIDVEEELSKEEFRQVVGKACHQIQQYDGFNSASIREFHKPANDQSEEERKEEAKALYELLDKIETEEEDFGELLEQAQEMAWRMLKDRKFMEDQDE